MAIIKRVHGVDKEAPFIPFGPMKIRIPFLHVNVAPIELVQGLMYGAIPMSAAAMMVEVFGMPFELAVILSAFYIFIEASHPLFGDPVVPGWITPAIPLVTAHVLMYEAHIDRIHALMAVQLLVAFIFIFMAVTGLAKVFSKYVPNVLRAGILIGSGMASVVSCIKVGGRMAATPIACVVGLMVTLFLLYSFTVNHFKDRSKVLKFLAGAGLIPGAVIAFIVGLIAKEFAFPTIEWGVHNIFRVTEIFSEYSIWAVGVPDVSFFIKGLPLAVMCYIIAFSDFVLAETVVHEADADRKDEYLEFSPLRSNIISGIRNLIHGITCPYITLCGPLWAGGTIATTEHYRQGEKQMDSLYDGCYAMIFGMGIACLIIPLVSLLEPIMPYAMFSCLMVQGFATGYISVNMLKDSSDRDKCIAFLMGVTIATRDAAIGLAVGIVLYIIIDFGYKRFGNKTKEAVSESK